MLRVAQYHNVSFQFLVGQPVPGCAFVHMKTNKHTNSASQWQLNSSSWALLLLLTTVPVSLPAVQSSRKVGVSHLHQRVVRDLEVCRRPTECPNMGKNKGKMLLH